MAMGARSMADEIVNRVLVQYPDVQTRIESSTDGGCALIEFLPPNPSGVSVILEIVDDDIEIQPGDSPRWTMGAVDGDLVGAAVHEVLTYAAHGLVFVRKHPRLGSLSSSAYGAPGYDPQVDREHMGRHSAVVKRWAPWGAPPS